jgi:hypothetical protein
VWTRRKMLKTAGVAAIGMVAGAGCAEPPGRVSGVSGRSRARLLADDRFGAARAFAAALPGHSTTTMLFDGDLTEVWVKKISVDWRTRRTPLIGLTNHQALICLEGFARDHDYRLVFQARHEAGKDGMILHRMTGSQLLLRRVSPQLVGLDWSVGLARVLSDWSAQTGERVTRDVTGAARADDQGTLFSWLFAPRNAGGAKASVVG